MMFSDDRAMVVCTLVEEVIASIINKRFRKFQVYLFHFSIFAPVIYHDLKIETQYKFLIMGSEQRYLSMRTTVPISIKLHPGSASEFR